MEFSDKYANQLTEVRDQLMEVRDQLTKYCVKWRNLINGFRDVPEYVTEKIRNVLGTAQLLGRKFEQFAEILAADVNNNNNNNNRKNQKRSPNDYTTTGVEEDIRGFRDLLLLDFNRVIDLFKELDALIANNFQQKPSTQDDGKARSSASSETDNNESSSGNVTDDRKCSKKRLVNSRYQHVTARKDLVEFIARKRQKYATEIDNSSGQLDEELKNDEILLVSSETGCDNSYNVNDEDRKLNATTEKCEQTELSTSKIRYDNYDNNLVHRTFKAKGYQHVTATEDLVDFIEQAKKRYRLHKSDDVNQQAEIKLFYISKDCPP